MHASDCLWVQVQVWQKNDSKKERRCARERETLQPDSVSGSLEWHTAAEAVSAPLRSMVSWLLLGREQSGNIVLQPDREMKSKIHSCGWPWYCIILCHMMYSILFTSTETRALSLCRNERKKPKAAEKNQWVVIYCCYDLACAEWGVFLISKLTVTWLNSLLINNVPFKNMHSTILLLYQLFFSVVFAF